MTFPPEGVHGGGAAAASARSCVSTVSRLKGGSTGVHFVCACGTGGYVHSMVLRKRGEEMKSGTE